MYPQNKDDFNDSFVELPIILLVELKFLRSMFFNNEALSDKAFEATSSPGKIEPPIKSPFFEITSTTVAVPKSTTILNLLFGYK